VIAKDIAQLKNHPGGLLCDGDRYYLYVPTAHPQDERPKTQYKRDNSYQANRPHAAKQPKQPKHPNFGLYCGSIFH